MCYISPIRKELFCLLLLLFCVSGYGQNHTIDPKDKALIVLEGVVVDAQAQQTLPQAHIINQSLKRGTVTDTSGIFSLLAYVGDSLTVSYVGYLPTAFTIPNDLDSTTYFAEIVLVEDTIALAAVEVRPFPEKSVFGQAFMDMPLPTLAPAMRLHPALAGKPLDGVGSMLAEAQQKIKQTAVYQATNSPITFFYNKFNYQARQKRKIDQYRKELGLPEGPFID